MSGRESPHSTRADEFAELAELYLTATDVPQRAPQRRDPAFRELLIVGHLPVRSGVWLTPYADAIARENGPTALVRLDLIPATLELLRIPKSERDGEDDDDVLTLRQAVERAAEKAAVWIIRGSLNQSPADLARLDFDRITLLTGADEAAVVAASQIISELASALPRAESDDESGPPPIALAVVGTNRDEANEVVRRVNETAGRLGIDVALALCLPRMDSGIRCTTFASFADDRFPQVSDVLEWIDAAEGQMIARPVEEPAPAERPPLRLASVEEEEVPVNVEVDASLDGAAHREKVRHVDPAPPLPGAEPRRERIRIQPAPVAPVRVAGAGGVKLAPKPSHLAARANQAAPAAARHSAHRPLASFVEGLSPLPLRCPMHKNVELAVDEAGALHVLAREESLRELPIVEHWARAHAGILAMACRGQNIEPAGEITCHLFTDEPSRLADMHGSGIRLHVLAPVAVGSETAWYSAPLSV